MLSELNCVRTWSRGKFASINKCRHKRSGNNFAKEQHSRRCDDETRLKRLCRSCHTLWTNVRCVNTHLNSKCRRTLLEKQQCRRFKWRGIEAQRFDRGHSPFGSCWSITTFSNPPSFASWELWLQDRIITSAAGPGPVLALRI